MVEEFAPILKSSAPSRIVNVASTMAGQLNLDDPQFRSKNFYRNSTAYSASKQAERMLTVCFSEKLKGSGVSVNCCHPGVCDSPICSGLGFHGSESPQRGAETPVMLALSDVGIHETGKYFFYGKMKACQFASDTQAIQKLVDYCASFA
jgi:NAD(P)-dependent dehydrogenase (short-subunit alcohol dehydrogenase family)